MTCRSEIASVDSYALRRVNEMSAGHDAASGRKEGGSFHTSTTNACQDASPRRPRRAAGGPSVDIRKFLHSPTSSSSPQIFSTSHFQHDKFYNLGATHEIHHFRGSQQAIHSTTLVENITEGTVNYSPFSTLLVQIIFESAAQANTVGIVTTTEGFYLYLSHTHSALVGHIRLAKTEYCGLEGLLACRMADCKSCRTEVLPSVQKRLL